MRWSTQKRQEFIEARLFWEGRIGRKDLVDFFNISIPQATKDIKIYSESAPGSIRYDSSAKQYVATPDFKTKISQPSSEQYLTHLRMLKKDRERDDFFYGLIPSFSELPQFRRFVDIDVLRRIVVSIRHREAIKINYQSMSSVEPTTRWITPHALGYDGLRWHVRSLCHRGKAYKDFNLGRVIEIVDSVPHDIDHSIDFEWHNEIDIIIAPHESLEGGMRSCIERDYCMLNGEASLRIRAAFFYYFKVRFGFLVNNVEKSATEQQIQVLNIDRIDANIDLLKSMTRSKLDDLIASKAIELYM